MPTVQEWDEWFANTQDEQARREWAAAKSVHTEEKMLKVWAHIIEMNRITRATTHEVQDGGVQQRSPGTAHDMLAVPVVSAVHEEGGQTEATGEEETCRP